MTNDGHGLQAMDFRPDLETADRRPQTEDRRLCRPQTV